MRIPTEKEIQQVMTKTNMDRRTAINHLKQRFSLQDKLDRNPGIWLAHKKEIDTRVKEKS